MDDFLLLNFAFKTMWYFYINFEDYREKVKVQVTLYICHNKIRYIYFTLNSELHNKGMQAKIALLTTNVITIIILPPCQE